jgi:hypothetical protein
MSARVVRLVPAMPGRRCLGPTGRLPVLDKLQRLSVQVVYGVTVAAAAVEDKAKSGKACCCCCFCGTAPPPLVCRAATT